MILLIFTIEIMT